MLKRILTHRETQVRFLRFLVVGGTTYLVQVASMKLFLGWVGTNPAFTLSFVCGTLTHYSLNRFWAMPSMRGDTWRQMGEYLATAVLSYTINFSLFRLGLDVLGLSKFWSIAMAVPPSTLVVFLLLNYRVFRRSE
ncbi:MAG TPA: GtrA family protein [Opitutaceae bacterium]|nr:GtrA family protein [Opitutaceae bacterium]